MRPILAVLFLGVVAGGASVQATPLEVRLRALEPRTLPGIGIDLRATVANPFKTWGEVGGVLVHVQPAGRAPFWVFDREVRLGDCYRSTGVGPSSSREIALSRDPGGQKGLWTDYRLNIPGTYRVRVVLNAPDVPPTSLSIADLDAEALVSNEITIDVEEPHGVDADVWQALAAAEADQEWKSSAAVRDVDPKLAASLLARFPESSYAPWLAYALWRAGDGTEIEKLRGKYGRSPLFEQIEYEQYFLDISKILNGPTARRADDLVELRKRIMTFAHRVKHPYLACLGEKLADSVDVERRPAR